MNLIDKYKVMYHHMDKQEKVLGCLLIVLGFSIILAFAEETNKGCKERVVNKIGQLLGALLLTPITIIQISLQILSDFVTMILALITGVMTFIVLTIKLVKQIVTEISRFLIKNLPEDK